MNTKTIDAMKAALQYLMTGIGLNQAINGLNAAIAHEEAQTLEPAFYISEEDLRTSRGNHNHSVRVSCAPNPFFGRDVPLFAGLISQHEGLAEELAEDELKQEPYNLMDIRRAPHPAVQGLFNKFKVSRVDGTDKLGGKHHGCDYFVLDLTHDVHAREAIRAYAKSCAPDYPQLASDLMKKFPGSHPPVAKPSLVIRMKERIKYPLDAFTGTTSQLLQEAVDEIERLNELLHKANVDALGKSVKLEKSNPWKNAVLDLLTAYSMDATIGTAPSEILNRIIGVAVTMAKDPAINSSVDHPRHLDLTTLRKANIARLPQFKNSKGEQAHSHDDGSDWSLGEWMNAILGELGEAANIVKKVKRGDMTLDEARPALAKEFADTLTYLDITALQAGIDLGDSTVGKFNEVSERVGSTVRIVNNQVVNTSHENPLSPLRS